MCLALSDVLEDKGYVVTTAEDGETALEIIKKDSPDLVLLDMRLPGMDGIQVLEKINEIKPHLQVIMVTGYGNTDSAVEAMKLGAFDYVSKPFDNEHLVEVVEKAFTVNGLLKERRGVRRDIKERLGTSKRRSGSLRRTKSKLPQFLITVIIIISLAFAGFYLKKTIFWESRSFIVPYSNVSAFTWDGDHLWISDWFTQTVYKHNVGENMAMTKIVSLSDIRPRGLAWADNYLYSCDPWAKKIYKHNLDDSLSIKASYPAPGNNPSGLFYDGENLWSCDADADRIYKHEPDMEMSAIADYPSPGTHPIGLYYDGTYFWSADAETRRIYKHRLDDKLTVESIFEIPGIEDKQNIFCIFGWTGKDIWMALEGEAKLFQYNLRRLKKVGLNK